jgi:hypothetical protein
MRNGLISMKGLYVRSKHGTSDPGTVHYAFPLKMFLWQNTVSLERAGIGWGSSNTKYYHTESSAGAKERQALFVLCSQRLTRKKCRLLHRNSNRCEVQGELTK